MKQRPSCLFKWLRTAAQPLYFLDSSATLVFCNSALEDWVGCTAEQLVGQPFRYHASISRHKHALVAAALAPPPEVFQGVSRHQLLIIDHITSQSRRYARFFPIQSHGVLVLVDSTDAPTSAPLIFPETSEVTLERQQAAELHQSLQVMRHRQAGRFRWDRLIGTSPIMQRVRRQARLAVESSVAVLILGEPGTGKEHLAKAIHVAQTADPPGALIPVDCQLLDQDLIAATILAFRNHFENEESTRRHTLLLQAVDQFPSQLIPLLVDFQANHHPQLRMIATSTLPSSHWGNHPSLPSLLGTIQIELPPLRERLDDLQPLAQMFLEEHNATASMARAGFSSAAWELLASYAWPGNLAELEQMIAATHQQGSTVLVGSHELPERLRHVQATLAKPDDVFPMSLEDFLQNMEREWIGRALARASGNKSKAAELLGLSRPRLYRRMELLGLLNEPETE